MLSEILDRYELVIGLEVHAQLRTHTKLMSAASNQFGENPNTAVSTICTGLPGALPVLNEEAVRQALLVAMALECSIQKVSIFSRKHYFYPDLPKGYQISQYDRPYALKGRVPFYFKGEKKSIGLTRIHIEEDAGKNLHFEERGASLVDLNRSSVPLIEIVSEPELRSAEEAAAYLKALRLILRTCNVCDGNLEEGNFRVDANVSLRPLSQKAFGTRVELKNINSFRNLEKAIEYEALRQFDVLEQGGTLSQETRLWDAEQNKSHSMRSKEEASDYRYMPEPDLLPLILDESLWPEIKAKLPRLPMETMDHFMTTYGRSLYDAEVLTASRDLADLYETTATGINDAQLASNFIQTHVLAKIADPERDIATFYPDAPALTLLLKRIKDGTLSLNLAKDVFEEMMISKKSADEIISEKNLAQISDESALVSALRSVLAAHPTQVNDFRSGKEKIFGFLMGQCQKALAGKANPALLKSLLEKELRTGSN